MINKRRLSFYRGFYWTGLLILIVSLILLGLPLTGTFGYEFAAINGLLIVIISGLFTLISITKSDYRLFNLFINLLFLVLIPLVIIIIKSSLTMFCSFWDGLFFYVLIVITSALFGSSLAFLIDFVIKRFKKTIFLLAIFIIALVPILEIYFLPQVYFYSPLIGFFPGNIYDEGLSPDWKLLLHQLFVFIFSGLIIVAILLFKRVLSGKKIIFVLTVIIVAVAFQFSSSWLGFNTTFSKLDKILYKKSHTDRFFLHYDNLSFNEARYVTENIFYYYLELEKKLQVKPSKQIHIYLFNNRQQKKELFGAGNADVAKPWQYSIYLSADSWEQTLKHELVHIFSAEFGTGLFKLASGFNPALIEGIAEAIEGSTDNYSLIDFTSLAFNNNHKIDISSLFSGLNFFKSNSSLAYTYSGAFIQFLIEKYEIEKVKNFYKDGNFNSVFNSDIKLVQKEFQNKLKASSFGNQAMADYYFGRLSILQKVCPRYISDRLGDAYEYLNYGKLDDAEKLFKEINDKSTNYSALFGLSEIYLRQEKISKAIDILTKNLNKFDRTPYYYNLKFRLADLFSLQNKNDSAKFYYESIINENPHHDLLLLSSVRMSLLGKNLLNEYLKANDSTMFRLIIQLNDSTYNYNSIPVMINLTQRLKLNYDEFIKEFNKTFIVDNLESSFAAFKLSQYMLANLDFANGRKYAALSLRYKDKNPFYAVMNENYEKANSFYINIKNATRLNY